MINEHDDPYDIYLEDERLEQMQEDIEQDWSKIERRDRGLGN